MYTIDQILQEFPSPCGEKVGINTSEEGFTQAQVDWMFPSPCGEKVGINCSFYPAKGGGYRE